MSPTFDLRREEWVITYAVSGAALGISDGSKIVFEIRDRDPDRLQERLGKSLADFMQNIRNPI
jgi:hypothetical protein